MADPATQQEAPGKAETAKGKPKVPTHQIVISADHAARLKALQETTGLPRKFWAGRVVAEGLTACEAKKDKILDVLK